MKALLIGYGKMGKLIHESAKDFSVDVTKILSPTLDKNDHVYHSPSKETFSDVDVAIDFSSPEGLEERVTLASEAKVPLVIGTTGWDIEKSNIKKIITTHNNGCIYSANFSLGVLLYFKLIEKASILFNPFPSYDCALFEAHHREKKDHPSGTAKKIADILLSNIDSKSKIVEGPEVKKDEISVTSMRCGKIPGEHTVIFDSEEDTISITHSAKSRAGFAKGALLAAKWIVGRKGCFNVDDFISELLKV